MAPEMTKEQLVAIAKLRVEASREDLAEYGEFVFDHPCMPHHRRWCEALSDDRIKRLMILAPPAGGKSTWIGKVYLSWKVSRFPGKHFAYVSYAQTQAEQRFDAVRETIGAAMEYRMVFPSVKMNAKRTSGKDSWTLVRPNVSDLDPTMKVLGLEGTMMGYHFDEIVLDDPHNPEAMISKVGREKTDQFFTGTLMSRLNRGGRLVVCGFRWAEDDLPGRLLERGTFHTPENCDRSCERTSWHLIDTPAIVEVEGEKKSYWPEAWPVETLEDFRFEVKERAWNAQYMQRPRPDDGDVFKHWFKYETPPTFKVIVVGFDSAFTAKERSDYTAWSGWGFRDGRAYFIDAGRIKAEGGDAERHIGMFAEKLRKLYPRVPVKVVHRGKVGIDRLTGQFLQRRNLPVIPLPMPPGDLEAIANLISPYFEGASVLIPEQVPDWWMEEMKQYPMGAHDDGVAATVAALYYLFLHNPVPRQKRPIYLWERDVA